MPELVRTKSRKNLFPCSNRTADGESIWGYSMCDSEVALKRLIIQEFARAQTSHGDSDYWNLEQLHAFVHHLYDLVHLH
jgi:hypothetical protein